MKTLTATAAYVQSIIAPLIPDGLQRIEDRASPEGLRIRVYVTTSSAKARVIGKGGETIHAIFHLAREYQRKVDLGVRLDIDVILGGER